MSAPAGWHPDPESQGVLRYWDGQVWTNHRAPGQAATAPKDQSALVALGFALAILFPIGGFIVGIVLERKESWWILTLSLLFGFGWFYVFLRLNSGY
ncbi:DUF2510 domain-containing protein [Nocardioides aurantiacus]|uniref:Uncharacterized protein DUF2510 n=1 Tax=Nocardioides aurantiacus TaxID=86796 RepID=A0A3N2CX29_9ACTN|nr:DUF2510 domain-containing protein [Nocardioides aurantiacus]ROR91774.1 uncharacterized protein DUF2510 [Nocardioides aurantiacus]